MLIDQVPGWSGGTQLVVAGVAAYVVVDRLHRAARSGGDRSAPWVAWFAFVLGAGLVANVWVLSAPSARVDHVAFVRSVLLIAVAVTLVPVAARLAGVHVPRWTVWLLAVVGLARLMLWPMSGFVSAHSVSAAGALEYGSLVGATALPAAALVVAGTVSVLSRWDDRVERATFASGVSGALVLLVASFLVAPALGEVLTGWGLAPLVLATVMIVIRRHRRRDDLVDELELVAERAHERIERLEVRADLACAAAGAAWWEYRPADDRFVADDRAWQLLEGDDAAPTPADSVALERVVQHLRTDARLAARHHLRARRGGRIERRLPLRTDARWVDVSANTTSDTDPTWIVGIARDVTHEQLLRTEAAIGRARGLHQGPGARHEVASLCDAWLSVGHRVRMFVIEVRGLDELGLVTHDGAVEAALDQVIARVAWAQPSTAQTAALSDRHVVVVVPDVAATVDVDELATRFHGLFERPVEVAGHRVRLSGSIGIAEGPSDGGRFGVLVARARAVAARAATGAPATRRFDVDDLDRVGLDLHLAAHVAWALQHDAITVVYQPVVDATSGAVRSVEALVRCWHPALGEVPTEQIVMSAEQHGTSLELFRTVLHAALIAVRHWRRAGLLEAVSVNVAPALLADPRTAELVDQELAEVGVPARALVLEVTEHVDLDDLVGLGAAIRSRGIRIAIDDFGAGRSTVGRLAGMMVDVVKLDRSLVSGLDVDERRERVVALTNDVVHQLGALVVAEGVETETEAAALRDAGVDALQGFGICRPLPYEAMTAYLEQTRRPRQDVAEPSDG